MGARELTIERRHLCRKEDILKSQNLSESYESKIEFSQLKIINTTF